MHGESEGSLIYLRMLLETQSESPKFQLSTDDVCLATVAISMSSKLFVSGV